MEREQAKATQVKEKVDKSLNSIGKTADKIAVELYTKGVRGAIPSNSRSCAIAQYLTKEVNEGCTASVGLHMINIVDPFGTTIFSMPTPKFLHNFIKQFDRGRYEFLT